MFFSPAPDIRNWKRMQKVHFGKQDWIVLKCDGTRAVLLECSGAVFPGLKSPVLEWKYSALRGLLHNELTDLFVNPGDLKYLRPSRHQADDGSFVEDVVFLLSKEEVENYLPLESDRALHNQSWYTRTCGFGVTGRRNLIVEPEGTIDSGGEMFAIVQERTYNINVRVAIEVGASASQDAERCLTNVLSGPFAPNVTEADRRLFSLVANLADAAEVERAILAGGNVDLTLDNKATLLAAAALFKRTDIARVLLKHGADPNLPGPDDKAPLYLATFHGLEDMVDMLIAAGANPNALDSAGLSPIYVAAQNGHLSILKKLITAGANTSFATPRGFTTLMNAADEGHKDCVEYLLDNGADAQAVSQNGQTAAQVARESGHYQVAELIESRCGGNRYWL